MRYKGFPARLGFFCFVLIFVTCFSGNGSHAATISAKSPPLAGDWPTFGNGPAHTGYFPGKLGSNQFNYRWDVTLNGPLKQVAAAQHKVYVTQYPGDGKDQLTALDEASGLTVWQYPFWSAYAANPPTYDSGAVYVMGGDSAGTKLLSINANDASLNWAAATSSQWGQFAAPCIADGTVWAVGDYNGTLYGFNQTNGSIRFNVPSSSWYQIWQPTYFAGHLLTWFNGYFSEYTPETGELVWQSHLDPNGWGADPDSAIAAATRQAYFIGSQYLYAMNVNSHDLVLLKAGNFVGTPAVANGVVYALSRNAVAAFDSTGTTLRSFQSPIPLQFQPIITDDVVIVGGDSETYILELATFKLRQTLNVGGYLSLANGILYVATSSGQLYAFSAAQDKELVIEGSPLQCGHPMPQMYGSNFFSGEARITNQVDGFAETNGGRFKCVGWTGTGSVPATGTDTVVVITLQTNSSLTWNWEPVEFQLVCSAAGPGQVTASNGWYAANVPVTVTAVPKAGCQFINWVGNLPSEALTNATLTLPMDQACHIVAVFAPTGTNRLTGDWPTFGNGPSHSGYFPGFLGNAFFTNRWVTSFATPLHQAAVGANRVYITPTQWNGDAKLSAIDTLSGQLTWEAVLPNIDSVSPPTFDNGDVYVQTSGMNGQLLSVAAASGAIHWQSHYSNPVSTSMAPIAAEGRILTFANSGYNLCGFDQNSGSQLFSQPLDFRNLWICTYTADHLLTWTSGRFHEHDLSNGKVLWTAGLPWSWSGTTENRAIAAAGNRAYCVGGQSLSAMDLTNKAPAWSLPGSFVGTPAIANGIVYAISNDTVAAFGEDGSYIGSYVADSKISVGQPIITDDVLIVSTAEKTLVFGLYTHALKQTINVGGQLSLANEVLYVASASGQLYAFSSAHEVQLIIQGNPSPYGLPSPALYGTNFITAGSTITNCVIGFVETNMGHFRCIGWTGNGSVASSGTDTVVVVTMQTNSTLTWNWKPVDFQLDCRATIGGQVNATNAWYGVGTSVTISAIPQPGFQFVRWVGDFPPDSATNSTLTFSMDQGRHLEATFGAIASTSTNSDWTTFGNGPAHTGYVPGLMGDRQFALRWTSKLEGSLKQVVTGDNRIYVTADGQGYLAALDPFSAQLVWRHSFTSPSLSPATFDSGMIYAINNSQLWSLDAASGTTQWQSYSWWQQSEFAPTIAGGTIWMDGGYGELYAFSQKDGVRLYSTSVGIAESWAPTYSDGRLVTWLAGTFLEHNPQTSSTIWYTNLGGNWPSYLSPMNRTIAASGGYAYFVNNPNLYCMDLSNRAVAWIAPGDFSGTPAFASGLVYAICGSNVLAYTMNGTSAGSYPADSALKKQPIVTDDTLIVASDSNTYVFDLLSRQQRQKLAVGGNLSLAGNVLYVAGSSGELASYSCGPDIQVVIQGNPLPLNHPQPQGYGTNTFPQHYQFTNQVDALVETNMGRYHCVGWTGTGSVPPAGTDTVVVATLEAPSTLQWNWAATEFQLTSTVAGFGYVDVSNAWYAAGTLATINATPNEGYRFVKWTGDVPNDLSTNSTLTLPMNQGRRLMALFSVAQPGALSGDWPTFGGNVTHSGYAPGLANDATFNLRWKINMGRALRQAAISGNRVYVTGQGFLACIHEYTGQILWQYNLGESDCMNPPTYDSGAVYVQRGNNGGKLMCINAATGRVNWQKLNLAEPGEGMAPTIADGQIWFPSSAGVCRISQANSSDLSYSVPATYSGWAPTYYNGRLLSSYGSSFQEYDPLSLDFLWQTNFVNAWLGYTMNHTIAAADGHAYFVTGPSFMAMDLTTHSLAWSVAGNFSGNPAVANGIVYAISNNTVAAFNTNGQAIASYVADSSLINQPIVTDDIIIVSSPNATYVFDRFSNILRQQLPVGGFLSLANHALYITDSGGYLHAYSLGEDVTLVVGSSDTKVGSPFPFVYGTNSVSSGAQISPRVVSPTSSENGKRYRAIGWTGTGSVPPAGTDCVTTFTITTNSSINWNWKKEYYLNITNTAQGGSVNSSSGWFDDGTELTLTATPAPYFHFVRWEGSITNSKNVIGVTLDRPLTLKPRFDADLVAQNVPKWWLAQYGLPVNNSGAMADSDHDGVTNWQEYAAGSNPTIAQAAPRFTTPLSDQTVAAGTDIAISPYITGTTPLSYQWEFRGNPIANQTNLTLALTNLQIEDSGPYTLLIQNPAGRARSTLKILVTNELSWAVNAANCAFRTSDESPWFAQTNTTHDGISAAQCDSLSYNQPSWMETTITGPATISFWWKISNSQWFASLNLLIDESQQDSITGDSDWQEKIFTIPAGNHVIRWEYQPYDSLLHQNARAWFDQLTITPGLPKPITITQQPKNAVAARGSTVTLTVKATGAPITYQWYFEGGAIDGAVSSELKLYSIDEFNAGSYFVTLTGVSGTITSQPAVVGIASSLSTALEYGGILWDNTGSDASWFLQKRTTHDGADAAQSGKITAGQYSQMANVVYGPGTLTFWWKVSSEAGSDILSFSVEDNVIAQISGDVGWQKQTYHISSSGNSGIQFSYSKDNSIDHGSDCGWVDSFSFTPDSAPVISKNPKSQTAYLGSAFTLSAEAQGAGSLTYTWFHDQEQVSSAGPYLKISNVRLSDAGNYYVMVANDLGSVTSASAVITVIPAVLDQTAIAGANVTLSIPAIKDQPPCRQWYFSDTPLANGGRIHGANTSRLSINKVGISDGGVYSAENFASCSLTVLDPSCIIEWGQNDVRPPSDLTDIVAISVGGTHDVALQGDGTPLGWGANNVGQLDFQYDPIKAKAICAGYSHTLVLQEDGTVLAYGDDHMGQIELPAGLTNVIAIAAGSAHSLALKSDGTVVAWGWNDSGQSSVPEGLNDAIQIAAGGSHSLALRKNGTILAWGDNSYGQTIVPASASHIIAISAGAAHSLALKKNGTVVAWGANDSGQTNVPINLSGITAVAAGDRHSLALKSNGTVTGWGLHYLPYYDYYTDPVTPPVGLKNVNAIAAGENRSLALIQAPVILTQPSDVAADPGQYVEFAVTAVGRAPLYYQWRYNDQLIRSATNSSLSLDSVQGNQSGRYSVLVRNAQGSTLSSSAQLKVSVQNSHSSPAPRP